MIIDQAAASLVSLTATTSSTGHATVIIAHSHLRDRFLGFPRAESVPGRILITAHDELPAAYEAVVKVFAASDLPEWTLRIAGAVPAELEDSYTRTLADHTGAFSLRDEALSDAARVEEISQAELVVVAAPESNESQSIILLALSLDRAVLVEDTAAMRTLADEVGSEWVRRHPGALTADALETALLALRSSPPADRPNLDAREPNAISAQYTAVFRAAAGEH
nr:hypothetical protein [Microbacterium aquimaris]